MNSRLRRKVTLGLALGLALASMAAVVYGQSDATTRATAPDATKVKLTEVVGGLSRPLYLTGAGDGSGRLFVVEQTGKIRIVQGGKLLPTPFIDLADTITREALQGGYTERGLLGLAFDPNFKTNHNFYVDYTDRNGDSAVARYQVTGSDPNVADPTSAKIILTQKQPFSNHKGGQLAFSPKNGYLYIGFGDGGSEGDPQGYGQNKSTFLGKILRIDVSSGDEPYAIPADNPVVRDPALAPEIWDYGLRNPWRFSFDAVTGDLWIGDVGQYLWEEIDFEPATSRGGNNFGWNLMEANHVYNNAQIPPDVTLIPPVFEYAHQQGISVTGGFVYRGSAIPELQGVYLFSDWGFGTIWATYRNTMGSLQTNVFMPSQGNFVSSFGQDDDHELYFTDYNGSVFRFDPA